MKRFQLTLVALLGFLSLSARADVYTCVFRLQGTTGSDTMKFDTEAEPREGTYFQATYFLGVVDTAGFGLPADRRIQIRATRASLARYELGAREMYVSSQGFTIHCRKD